MDAFLAAQADSPFDPASMLMWADHLEESGDLVGASALRGLVGAGIPSLLALAFDAPLVSTMYWPDCFWEGYGGGIGDSLGRSNRKDGAGGGVGDQDDEGFAAEGNGRGDGHLGDEFDQLLT